MDINLHHLIKFLYHIHNHIFTSIFVNEPCQGPMPVIKFGILYFLQKCISVCLSVCLSYLFFIEDQRSKVSLQSRIWRNFNKTAILLVELQREIARYSRSYQLCQLQISVRFVRFVRFVNYRERTAEEQRMDGWSTDGLTDRQNHYRNAWTHLKKKNSFFYDHPSFTK